jgi:hypothetical protein
MKKIIKLTENDLRGIIKRSVNRILREAEGDEDLDYNGFYDSLKTYLENPVDVMKGDYEPSADDINAAMQGLDLDDTDFSDLMGGDDNLYGESRRRMSRIIRESVKNVLNEMPTGKKIQFRDDNRDVYRKFASRARNPKFGLDKSSQRQLGVMYAEADLYERDDLAERIYQYASEKQEEYSRMNSKGNSDLEWKLYNMMRDAFIQGEREYHNEDIWTDDDPVFTDWNNPNQFESRNRIGRIIKESIRKVMREASVYPGYDSTTTEDIADNGGGNIITCYGNPGVINGKYQGGGAGTILGSGVIYLSCNPPSGGMTRMYGQLVPVKVDVSNFYRAKDAWEAKKLIGLVGFKDEYSGILYHSNRDGDVCAVFDRSCIIE